MDGSDAARLAEAMGHQASAATAAEYAGVKMDDSDQYPWVEDLDGLWHRRPPGQPWVMDREDGGNAETLCGQWVPSVHVSADGMDTVTVDQCPACVAAVARST